jgi:L-idonate 5-dehydrogenase
VSLMQKGLINVSDLITQNVPLHEAIAGFEMASDRGSALKVQIAF